MGLRIMGPTSSGVERKRERKAVEFTRDINCSPTVYNNVNDRSVLKAKAMFGLDFALW